MDTKKKNTNSRRKSRELALKGLYALLLRGGDADTLLRDLREDEDYALADTAYFESLLQGIATHRDELDARIAPLLSRPLREVSPIEHAILCLSCHELAHAPDIPYRVVINEGVELAKRYGGTDGYKFVNGVLDRLAAQIRPEEFSERHPEKR